MNQGYTKSVQYETFKNISQPTEFFDTIIVFIKIFMIFLTVLVGILYLVKMIHSNNQKSSTDDDDNKSKQCSTRLCKSIDNINNILYHMIIIIYFIIAIIVLFAFRDKIWNAVHRGRKKLGEIMGDVAKKSGISKPSESHNLTNDDIHKFAYTAARAASTSQKQQKSCPKEELPAHVHTLSDFMKSVKSNEMKDYAMSLVWWNMLFLLPVYAGLFTSRNTANSLITTFA